MRVVNQEDATWYKLLLDIGEEKIAVEENDVVTLSCNVHCQPTQKDWTSKLKTHLTQRTTVAIPRISLHTKEYVYSFTLEIKQSMTMNESQSLDEVGLFLQVGHECFTHGHHMCHFRDVQEERKVLTSLRVGK